MNISILGFSVSVEILILIGIIYLIMVINTLSSCCNVPGMLEGFEMNGMVGGVDDIVKDTAKQIKEGLNFKKYVKRAIALPPRSLW